jgi:hypothetical protein
MPEETTVKKEVSKEDQKDALLLVLMLLPMILFQGWILSFLWGWFIVPLGVLPIRFWQAAGIRLLVREVLNQFDRHEGKVDFGRLFVSNFILPMIALGIGYFLHWAMGR